MGRIAFLIPEFAQQTHVAWWRISRAMSALGHTVDLVSTRRPGSSCPHPVLVEEMCRTSYIWPPSVGACSEAATKAYWNQNVKTYLRQMASTPLWRKLALLVSAVSLRRITKSLSSDHLFVHSCADAAHVAALCKQMGGPNYSLRLGGDLRAYGTDHRLKMAGASLIATAAKDLSDVVVGQIGIPRSQVMWTWVGTDTDLFRPRETPRAPGPWRIITVARLNVAKGYQYMLPAIASLLASGLEVEYEIIGEGPFRSEILGMVQALGIQRSVRLIGSASSEVIAERHRESDLFVLPTSGIGEGTPAAVCEAMSSGLPIVATQVGGLADMVEAGRHGWLVETASPDALAFAIRNIVANPSLMQRMARECRVKAIAEFSCLEVARRLLDTISRIQSVNP